MKYKPTVKGTIAVLLLIAAILAVGYIEALPADKKDSKVIVIPNTNSKQIIVLEGGGSSTTIIDLDKNTIQFCTSSDGSIIMCQDLN